jgi:hypothetical protein
LENKGLKRLFSWLFDPNEQSSTQRKADRHTVPGLVAYFPLGHTLEPHEVRNISTEGFYVVTEERWTPGTSLVVSLQIVNPESRQVDAMISVPSQVVWLGPDGVGFTFDVDPGHRRVEVSNVEQLVQLQRFLQKIKQ